MPTRTLAVVLTEPGCGQAIGGGCAAEVRRQSGKDERASVGMANWHIEAPGGEVLVFDQLFRVEDGHGRDCGVLQRVHQLDVVPRPRPGGDGVIDLVVGSDALVEPQARQALVDTRDATKRLPVRVAGDANRYPTVI